MTAAQTTAIDTNSAKAESASDSTDKKVAANLLADPNKLMADSTGKPPLLGDTPRLSPSAAPFLTFDYSIYQDNTCKVSAYSPELFDLTDPNLFFSRNYDLYGNKKIGMTDLATDPVSSYRSGAPWSAARRDLINRVSDSTFDLVFDEPADLEKVKNYSPVENASLATILKGHKPGEEWQAEDGSKCRATPDGGVVQRESNGDVRYIGRDGKSFTKHGKDETWSSKGETIEKHVDGIGKETYLKRFADGTTAQIVEDKDIKAIHELEFLTVTQHRSRLAESRAAFDADNHGVNQHSDGQDYVKDDLLSGDRLRKDNHHSYALLKTKAGKFYAIQNGHVYQFDMDTHRFSHDELPADKIPPSLKRNADGSMRFGTATLSDDNSLTDSANGLKFPDGESHITARSHGQNVVLSVEQGNETLNVGDRTTTYDSSQDKLAVTSKDHASDLSFDYQSRTLQTDGITFKPNETDIDGVCSLNENTGDVSFTDGAFWIAAQATSEREECIRRSASASAELHATVNEAAALGALIDSPGAQEGVLSQLFAILGKLNGIAGGVEFESAKALSKATVNSQIDRTQALSNLNRQLFGAGKDNATIAEAIARRGPGVTDEFIIRQILESEHMTNHPIQPIQSERESENG